MTDNEYADQNYYQSGPLAVPNTVKDQNGNPKTIYLDINTGQVVNNLSGYTVYDGENYWKPSESDDTNKDGVLDADETTGSLVERKQEAGSGKSVAAGGGSAGTASNNFGYQHKPGALGAIGMAASLVNPGVGSAIGMFSKAMNVNNMDAVNSARKGLGLSPLTGGQMVKGALKDNKGQIANVNIGDNKYSVGFEAMSPDNKTNLTYNEAKTRAAMLGQKITETPKDQVTPAPKESEQKSFMSKITGLDKGFARKALGIEKKTPEDKIAKEVAKQTEESPASKVTGLQKGWLSRALTDLTTQNKVSPEVAANLPDVVSQTPTARPEDTQVTPSVSSTPASAKTGTGYSQAASAGLPDSVTEKATGPSQSNPLGVGAGSVGFAGAMANNPAKAAAEHPGLGGIIDGSQPDRIGRVGLMSVDPSKMGLNPAMAAQVKSFQAAAVKAGVADKLSINVLDAVRTPEQQAAIKAAGYSKTNFGYHNIGLAVDISPTAINEKDQIVDQATLATSRQIAKDLGLSTLNASFDPAHVEAHVKGLTARQIGQQAIDPTTGLPGLSPEQDLGVRNNSVPTPTARPDPTTTALSSKTFDSQVGLNAPAPSDPDQNAFGRMKQDMNTLSTATTAPTSKLDNTPAGLAAMGFTQRTPEEKAAISRTVAGELGQKSLSALRGKDPEARARAMAEVGSMVATMENRAATKQYSGVAKTLAPSQYNANMAVNAAVTNQNYASNPAVSKAVGQFYAGGIPGTQYGATNYHATAMKNAPSWSGQMQDATAIGQHTFGSLPGYSPDANNQSRMDAFGTMAGTQFSPGKKSDDTVSNPGFAGSNTPSGMKNSLGSSSATTGLGVHDPSKSSTPGYGGAGLGYGGVGSGAAAGSLGNPGGTSGAGGASGSQGTGSGSSSSGSNAGGGSSGAGSSNSRSGADSPAGGYSSGASKGSTGGL